MAVADSGLKTLRVWDEESGDVRLKRIVETYVKETDELVHVWVNGEEIVATPGHPFYSPVKGWTEAAQLRAGDILVLVNGEYVVVEKVQHELLESPVKVYNFQVEDYHTYYVSDTGVLVHNNCGDTGTYNQLSRENKGSGYEVHHIIEKRFKHLTKHHSESAGRMQSVVLTKAEHRYYTNRWRKELAYGKGDVTTEMVINAAKNVYSHNRWLLDIALSEF